MLTVMLAWISDFFPYFPMNLHVNSSTLAETTWNRSWVLVKTDSRVRISSLRLLRQAISDNVNKTSLTNLLQQSTLTLLGIHKCCVSKFDAGTRLGWNSKKNLCWKRFPFPNKSPNNVLQDEGKMAGCPSLLGGASCNYTHTIWHPFMLTFFALKWPIFLNIFRVLHKGNPKSKKTLKSIYLSWRRMMYI